MGLGDRFMVNAYVYKLMESVTALVHIRATASFLCSRIHQGRSKSNDERRDCRSPMRPDLAGSAISA